MIEALSYPFFQRALLAGLLAGVICGVVGTLVVVKRMASVSGSLSHAAFGGVGLAYFLGWPVTLGAVLFSVLTGAGLGMAYRRLGTYMDTLVAMIWALGMAVGILFISLVPGYAPDLMNTLFGSILFVPRGYLWFLFILSVTVLVLVSWAFKELQALCFDEEYAEVVGIPAGAMMMLLMALVGLGVVATIRVVGVILVIALMTIPAAIAGHWTERLSRQMVLASILATVMTWAGLLLSFLLSTRPGTNIPAGPLIILLAGAAYGASHLLRARKGTLF